MKGVRYVFVAGTAEIKELERGNGELAKEIEEKRAKIKRLQDNPEAQELEIRRQLKLVHPGEKIFNSQDQDKQTLPLWLSTFRTAFSVDWGGIMAASVIYALPALVFFIIVQRKLVSGMTAGAVKG